ncbi:hypothetical protein Q3G72_007193 [Acer saccharum]|nr:hypothetical protein Q3G72_007193 [Acer saccharum]
MVQCRNNLAKTFKIEVRLPCDSVEGDIDAYVDEDYNPSDTTAAVSHESAISATSVYSEDEKGNPKPVVRQRGKPYIESANGRVVLEVGQMFNNLHHFRLILREVLLEDSCFTSSGKICFHDKNVATKAQLYESLQKPGGYCSLGG